MKQYRIIIADDADFMRLALKDVLTKKGLEIVGEAKNGQEAIELYCETRPDLILMDITMPGMDGLEALRKIRTIDPEAKAVMCSALSQKAIVMESIMAGAATFVVKPFDADLLIRTINKVLGREPEKDSL